MPNQPKSILTNPEDMEMFIKMIENVINQLKGQQNQIKQQASEVQKKLNEQENVLGLLKDWQEIMSGDDLTLIKMAYADIKKNMTKVIIPETK